MKKINRAPIAKKQKDNARRCTKVNNDARGCIYIA
jgi:hypothetical protein